jgi:hypothetical protein
MYLCEISYSAQPTKKAKDSPKRKVPRNRRNMHACFAHVDHLSCNNYFAIDFFSFFFMFFITVSINSEAFHIVCSSNRVLNLLSFPGSDSFIHFSHFHLLHIINVIPAVTGSISLSSQSHFSLFNNHPALLDGTFSVSYTTKVGHFRWPEYNIILGQRKSIIRQKSAESNDAPPLPHLFFLPMLKDRISLLR